MDAFTAAFRIPNLLRDLFAEGALSTAFVTTFSKTIARGGDGAAWQLANKVATLTAIVLGAICVLGMVFSPQLVALLAPGFDPQKAALTVQLTRIMFPFILLVSLAALVMGMLNAKSLFGMPAMASSFFNIGSIVGGVMLGAWIDPHFGPARAGRTGDRHADRRRRCSSACSCRRCAVSATATAPTSAGAIPGVRAILALMGPSVIAASTTQVNVLINSMFASDARRRTDLLAVDCIPPDAAAAGTVRRRAGHGDAAAAVAAGGGGRHEQRFAPNCRAACAWRFLLTLPSTVGLMMLAGPIISVLYQHGKFDQAQAAQAAGALRFYAVGLSGYAALKVLVNAFYALDQRKTPMIVSFLAVALNLLFNWVFTFRLGWGVRGLAFSTGCVASCNFLVLYLLMRRHLRGLETRRMWRMLLKLAVPSLVLVALCGASAHWLLAGWATQPFWSRLTALLGTVLAGAAAFVITGVWLRIEELQELISVLRRRLHAGR